MASRTLAFRFVLTGTVPLITADTVEVETPARRATSLIVYLRRSGIQIQYEMLWSSGANNQGEYVSKYINLKGSASAVTPIRPYVLTSNPANGNLGFRLTK
jgi:hypothetical protein